MGTRKNFYIDLVLFSNPIPPREISQMVGVTANTALLRGERNKEKDLPRQHIWALYSDAKEGGVEEHWATIEKKFGANWQKFVEISKKGTAKIAIVICEENRLSLPKVQIPVAMSAAAFELNAEIDIPYYLFDE